MKTEKRLLVFGLVGVMLMLVFSGCAPKMRAPEAELDTPEHHVMNGIKLLKKGNIDDAEREFILAKELDLKFSGAYTGLGLVCGHRGDFEKATENMKLAGKYADTKEEKADACIGYIRLYTLGKSKIDEDWLEEAEDAFDDAVDLSPDSAAAHFYMGVAYKEAYEFSDAAMMFSKVLDLDTEYVADADAEFLVVQKIQRAMPGTMVGKKIALVKEITRGDIAALFIEELNLDALYEKRTAKTFDTSYKDPVKRFETEETVKLPPATDIADYVLKTDVDAVIAIGIHGLEPYPDHTFRPNEKITRANYAVMIEDILIKVTGDQKLATKFIGSESPFPDLRNDLHYFNAVMVCTTRGILRGDVGSGEFKPMGTISGADALLAIRTLKSQIEM
ncbi:MAG: S-layer homology domain-containing protein [Proteobacteria bacterium]|nr:S-layer homology domain-containing protein [Pseudomonadota bacterium]